MLDNSSWKIMGAELHAGALPIVCPQNDLASPRHASADIGNAQAAFPVFDDVGADDRDFRIDDREWLGLLILVLVGIEPRDEDTYAFVHLRRCQTDTAVLD